MRIQKYVDSSKYLYYSWHIYKMCIYQDTAIYINNRVREQHYEKIFIYYGYYTSGGIIR